MVNFRFHIVSIIAVFLALALGIGMGATVIDKATVDFLRQRLDTVSNDVTNANRRSNDLERQIERDSKYSERAQEYLINERLSGVPVALLIFRGIETGSVGELKRVLADSGAVVQGTVWFTGKAGSNERNDALALQQILGASTADPGLLREALATRVAAVMAGTNDGTALKPLVDGGFLEWESEQSPGDIARVQFGASRLVVMSAFNPSVPNELLALPLTRLLASQPQRRVVAVEPGREPDARTSGERAVFLEPLRRDDSLRSKLSTVDNLESPSGRVATVLALAQLQAGVTGNYGVASSSQGPIPELKP